MSYKSRFRRSTWSPDGLPKGSVSSLQHELARLQNERTRLVATQSAAQSEYDHLKSNLLRLVVAIENEFPNLSLGARRADGTLSSQTSFKLLNGIEEAAKANKRRYHDLEKRLQFYSRLRAVFPKNVLHTQVLMEEAKKVEGRLGAARYSLSRNDPSFRRLGELESRLSRLPSLDREVELHKRALERELKKPESQMEILRARAATAEKENRDAAARMRDSIPRTERCPYCHEMMSDDNHVDHIVPVAHGGKPFKWNLVRICISCNLKKRDLTLLEFCKKTGFNYMTIATRLQNMGKRP